MHGLPTELRFSGVMVFLHDNAADNIAAFFFRLEDWSRVGAKCLAARWESYRLAFFMHK